MRQLLRVVQRRQPAVWAVDRAECGRAPRTARSGGNKEGRGAHRTGTAMEARRLLLLLGCLSAHWTCGTAHAGLGHLHPPTNITFGMNGMFCLFWKWTPTNIAENCSLWYRSEILSSVYPPPGGKARHLYYTKFLDSRLDLNNNLTLNVSTECDNITSEVKSFTSPLATGDPRTTVRDVTCVWHYKEYVNCTWRPGEDTPPRVNYSLHYWLQEEITCPKVENKQPTPFHDLLDEGERCQNYVYHREVPVGCQFRLENDSCDLLYLVAVVTDRSLNVKPYIYFIFVNTIAKLKAPEITKIERTPNSSVFFSWYLSDVPVATEYEVQLEMSNSEREESYLVLSGESKEIPNALPDVTYTVKVRARLHRELSGLPDPHGQGENFLWSEWSEQRILHAVKDERTAFIVILLLVSLVIIGATVLLLIKMRRLLICIFPRIPDPSKVISSDFQQWLKHGKFVYNEPKKEEVCIVSLLETSPSSIVE